MPLQNDPCYIKIDFPVDFGVFEDTLNYFYISNTDNQNKIRQSEFSDDVSLFDSKTDFGSRSIVFEGCKYNEEEDEWKDSDIGVFLSKVKNPDSLRDTGLIKLTIASDSDFTKII